MLLWIIQFNDLLFCVVLRVLAIILFYWEILLTFLCEILWFVVTFLETVIDTRLIILFCVLPQNQKMYLVNPVTEEENIYCIQRYIFWFHEFKGVPFLWVALKRERFERMMFIDRNCSSLNLLTSRAFLFFVERRNQTVGDWLAG